ncbi:hypothetical protein [Streptomyces sp. ISL-100]|uniref:hypothetical protein n=1 Tax=Streptomyces sp. ISL-100 TaxID=2819173 RepID=UPI001BEAC5ED|nr:hypothetical protein [Streptomyces sp. ISL-100]MBT2400771.1 hypothetical protein [Streptomyces sp. ISL-100]
MSAPAAGARLTVRVDADLSDDLAVLLRTGCTTSDAVRLAVAFLAHGYRWAWESGHYPDGVAPERMAMKVPPHPGSDQRV